MRNRVEGPSQFARPGVEAANVSRRRRKRLWIPAAGNEQVFINNHGARQENGLLFRRLTAEILAQINAAAFAEARYRLSRGRIQRVNEIQNANKNPRRF